MFCSNCGAPMPDGQLFCTSCGARLAAAQPAQPVQQPVQQPAQPVQYAQPMQYTQPAPQPPKKKKKSPVGWIIAGVVLVAAVAAVILKWDAIRNLFDKTLSTPENYYHKVELRAVDDITDQVAHPTGVMSLYNNMFGMNAKESNKAMQGSITLLPGQQILDLVTSGAEIDLSWFNSIGLTYVVDRTREDLVGAKAAVQLNGSDVVTMDGVYEPDTYMAYFRVPELSDQYAGVNAEELLYDYYWENGSDALYSFLSSAIYSGSEDYQNILNAMPDPETLAAILNRYGAIIVNDIDDVEKGSEKVTANGVTCTYTTLTVRLDEEDLEKIARDVMSEALEDKDIKDIIYAVSAQFDEDGDAMYESFQESLREALSEDSLVDGKVEIVMVVYVNGEGEVKGRDIRITPEGDSEIHIRYLRADNGSDFGIELLVDVPDEYMTLTASGKGTEKGDDVKGSLNVSVTVYDETHELGTIEFDGNKKDNNFIGTIIITPSQELVQMVLEEADLPSELEYLLDGVKLRIDNRSTEDHVDVDLTLLNSSGELVTLQLKSSPADRLDLAIPSNYLSADEWSGTITQTGLMTIIGNLQQAGVPMSFFSELGDLF